MISLPPICVSPDTDSREWNRKSMALPKSPKKSAMTGVIARPSATES